MPVFAALAGISREELVQEKPLAPEGKVSVQEWEDWLNAKGLRATRYQPGEQCTMPCAHLVDFAGMPHWIYQDANGVHDPNPAFQHFSANDPRMLALSFYEKLLTISVTPRTV